MCVKIFEITGPHIENELDNSHNISVALHEVAPKTLRREAVITFSRENIKNHRRTEIQSYHRLVFDQDWAQLINFFNFLIDPSADDQPDFCGTRFVVDQRPHQPGCFQVWCDPSTTFRKLPNGCELWMEMDNNPHPPPKYRNSVQDWIQDPIHPRRTTPIHEHWILFTNEAIKSIVALDAEVMAFFKNGLNNECNCKPNESFDLLTRCEKDVDMDSECRCKRCV